MVTPVFIIFSTRVEKSLLLQTKYIGGWQTYLSNIFTCFEFPIDIIFDMKPLIFKPSTSTDVSMNRPHGYLTSEAIDTLLDSDDDERYNNDHYSENV